jgi:aryl carrier-like protein
MRSRSQRLSEHPLAAWRMRARWREVAFQITFAGLHLYGAVLALAAWWHHAGAAWRVLAAREHEHEHERERRDDDRA